MESSSNDDPSLTTLSVEKGNYIYSDLKIKPVKDRNNRNVIWNDVHKKKHIIYLIWNLK